MSKLDQVICDPQLEKKRKCLRIYIGFLLSSSELSQPIAFGSLPKTLRFFSSIEVDECQDKVEPSKTLSAPIFFLVENLPRARS